MRAITKASEWDLYLQYQKDTGRQRPDTSYSDDSVEDYIAWLEDKVADQLAAEQYARQITDIITEYQKQS